MKGKKKLIKIIVCCVLTVAIIVGGVVFVRQKTDNKFEAVIMDVSSSTITQTLSTQGVVESTNREEFEIFDGVVVKDVYVKLGDRVEEGQLLATFELSSLNGILTQMQSDYDNAKINYQNSIDSAKEASAKLPLIESQIAELEKQLETFAENAEEGSAVQENIPEWIDGINYQKLVKLLGNTYSQEQIRDYFIELANKGAERKSVLEFISSLNSGSSFDITSMLGSSYDMEEMSLQMNLMTLKAQKTMLETQAQNILESTYKSLAETAEQRLNTTKEAVEKLAKGWYAQGEGVVSSLSISPGKLFVSQQSSSTSIDISSLLGMLSGGGDINSILSSLGGSAAKNIGLTIEYYDSFIASFSLGKYDILDVKVGQKATVNSLGHVLEGEVIYISPVASQNSGIDINSMISAMGGGTTTSGSNSIPAQVLIKNPDESVIIGIDVDIDIELGEVKDAVVVPIEAVETDDKGSYVYKFNESDSTVTRVPVELGLATDTQYQVVSGCNVGDKIVQNQALALKEIAEEGKKVAVTYVTDEAV